MITDEVKIRTPLGTNLAMCAEYFADGTSRLLWYTPKILGFCERTATYSFDGKVLKEEVVAVNEDNNAECGTDPDMIVGTKTETPIEVQQDKMHWKLKLGEVSATYAFRQITNCPRAGDPPP